MSGAFHPTPLRRGFRVSQYPHILGTTAGKTEIPPKIINSIKMLAKCLCLAMKKAQAQMQTRQIDSLPLQRSLLQQRHLQSLLIQRSKLCLATRRPSTIASTHPANPVGERSSSKLSSTSQQPMTKSQNGGGGDGHTGQNSITSSQVQLNPVTLIHIPPTTATSNTKKLTKEFQAKVTKL